MPDEHVNPEGIVARVREGDRQAEHEQRVTPLELFFDLVVVFAITQVTTFLSRSPTWGGLQVQRWPACRRREQLP
jgi:low temperature requirement protein LtrA